MNFKAYEFKLWHNQENGLKKVSHGNAFTVWKQ